MVSLVRMKRFLSRVLTHTCLAAVVALAVLLVLEWLLPGAVTTSIPIYPLTGCVAAGCLIGAPWMEPSVRWRRLVGFSCALLPTLVLMGTFIVNERTRFVGVSGVFVLLLVGALMVSVE